MIVGHFKKSTYSSPKVLELRKQQGEDYQKAFRLRTYTVFLQAAKICRIRKTSPKYNGSHK